MHLPQTYTTVVCHCYTLVVVQKPLCTCMLRAGGSNLTVVRPFPKKGGAGVLPRKILEKCCLLVHFGTINNYNFGDGTFMVNKTSKYTKTVLTTTYKVICTVN